MKTNEVSINVTITPMTFIPCEVKTQPFAESLRRIVCHRLGWVYFRELTNSTRLLQEFFNSGEDFITTAEYNNIVDIEERCCGKYPYTLESLRNAGILAVVGKLNKGKVQIYSYNKEKKVYVDNIVNCYAFTENYKDILLTAEMFLSKMGML